MSIIGENNREIKALISLIDDPDPEIYNDISDKIIAHGISVIPLLENAWETNLKSEFQTRIEGLIHKIQYEQVCNDLSKWTSEGGTDLLKGCMIIARYQYPSIIEEEIEYHIGKIRKDVWLEINDGLTALEQIRVFNYIFYELHGFSGNTSDYLSPDNSYINRVLESKRGNPLTLGIIYMIVAQSLEMHIYGVNLPDHFVLAYTGNESDSPTTQRNVLFYINVFSKGLVFSYNDLEVYLHKLNQKPRPEYTLPCSNTDIIIRMLNNLKNSYNKSGKTVKVHEIQKLIEIVKISKNGN